MRKTLKKNLTRFNLQIVNTRWFGFLNIRIVIVIFFLLYGVSLCVKPLREHCKCMMCSPVILNKILRCVFCFPVCRPRSESAFGGSAVQPAGGPPAPVLPALTLFPS